MYLHLFPLLYHSWLHPWTRPSRMLDGHAFPVNCTRCEKRDRLWQESANFDETNTFKN